MKTLKSITLTLALAASSAFANDHLNQVATQARELASDYRKMALTLKDKNFSSHELQQGLNAADTALAQIKALLSDYGATNPKLNATQEKDLKRAQDLVALLDVFHDRKTELLTGDAPHKNRSKIRTETQALITRAEMLEQTVQRLP